MGHYSTASSVKTRTGIHPEDLGFPDDEDAQTSLDNFLGLLLEEISDLMSRTMRRDWLAELDAGSIEDIPAGLNGIAADIAADSVRTMVQSRQTPVVRIDDFAIRTITSVTLSKDVLARLKLYSAGQGVGTYDVTQDTISDAADVVTAASLDTMDL